MSEIAPPEPPERRTTSEIGKALQMAIPLAFCAYIIHLAVLVATGGRCG